MLSPDPHTIEGGCNCGAIRYRVSVPSLASRPLYPAGGTSDAHRMPLAVSCSCNDCRMATGAVLPCALLTPADMVSASFAVGFALHSSEGKLGDEVPRTPWLPASEAFLSPSPDPNTTLTFFSKSASRRRGFCRRCGTMFVYQVFPLPDNWPEGWPQMLDFWMGTLDRGDFERLEVGRHLWWDYGVDWVKRLVLRGKGGAEVHPSYAIDKFVNMERREGSE